MKILVTGITGFVGKSLYTKFSPDDEIFLLSRTDPGIVPGNIHTFIGDLDTPGDLFIWLAFIRPDVCIHLAWEGIPDYGYEQSLKNLNQSSALICHLIEECGCKKVIAIGSCWEYGKEFGSCHENEVCFRGNYFVWAKRALCDFGLMLASIHQIAFIWARLFYVYGPGQRSGSLIPTLTEAVLNGNKPDIKTPYNANDFVYVDDVTEALLQFAHHEVRAGIYNIGTGVTVPIWKVCMIVEESLGYEPKHAMGMKMTDCPKTADFYADTTKTSLALNWHAGTSLEEGIRQYIRTLRMKD